MSESLLQDFELFFLELPHQVRNDLWFMMVVLSDENLVVCDPSDVYDQALENFIEARTRIGSIGNLISAVSIVDVYFAMDAHKRFATVQRSSHDAKSGHGKARAPRDHYSDRLAAIEAAKAHWLKLRASKFAPAALAAALIPQGPVVAVGDAFSVVNRAPAGHQTGAAPPALAKTT